MLRTASTLHPDLGVHLHCESSHVSLINRVFPGHVIPYNNIEFSMYLYLSELSEKSERTDWVMTITFSLIGGIDGDMDWFDEAYRGTQPWDIGKSQADFVRLS
jgi:hypothetical protein